MEKYSLQHIQWLDFSGSPLLLIPESLKENWLGIYHTEPEPDSIDKTPDFTFKGQDYFVNSEFDFDNPITDYDRLCQKLELALSYPFEGEEILALDAFFDTFAWDDEYYFVFNGAISAIDWTIFKQLEWLALCQWTVKSKSFYLINSCCTPLEVDINNHIDYQKIRIKSRTYQIEFAEYEDEYITRIFRFLKIS